MERQPLLEGDDDRSDSENQASSGSESSFEEAIRGAAGTVHTYDSHSHYDISLSARHLVRDAGRRCF